MNSTSLDINVSETLANKTLIVTTILVRSHLQVVVCAVLSTVTASFTVTEAETESDEKDYLIVSVHICSGVFTHVQSKVTFSFWTEHITVFTLVTGWSIINVCNKYEVSPPKEVILKVQHWTLMFIDEVLVGTLWVYRSLVETCSVNIQHPYLISLNTSEHKSFDCFNLMD